MTLETVKGIDRTARVRILGASTALDGSNLVDDREDVIGCGVVLRPIVKVTYQAGEVGLE